MEMEILIGKRKEYSYRGWIMISRLLFKNGLLKNKLQKFEPTSKENVQQNLKEKINITIALGIFEFFHVS